MKVAEVLEKGASVGMVGQRSDQILPQAWILYGQPMTLFVSKQRPLQSMCRVSCQ
jgi:hypothetical protein